MGEVMKHVAEIAAYPWLKRHTWPVLLLAFGGLLRVLTWRGICISDPGTYTELAYRLSEGQMQLGHAASVRLGVYAPAALVIRLFGVTDLSVGLIPFLASMGTVLLAYLLGRRFGSEITGRWTGLLVASLPIEIAHATCLFPEAMLTFWTLLATWLITKPDTRQPAPGMGLALEAGLAAGLAYVTKVSGIIVLPLLLAWLLARPRYRRRILPFTAGCMVVAAVEMLLFLHWTGDPLFSWRAVSAQQASMLSASAAEQTYQSLWIYPRDLLLDSRFAFVFPAWLIGLPLWVRHHQSRFPVVWLLVFFLFLEFGSSSWRTYAPVPHLPRYLSLLVVPLVICTAQSWCCPRHDDGGQPRRGIIAAALVAGLLLAALLFRFSHGILPALSDRLVAVCAVCACLLTGTAAACKRDRQIWHALPLVLVILFGSLSAIRDSQEHREGDNIRHAFRYFNAHPPSGPIYADGRTLSGLLMFWNYDPPVPLHELPGRPSPAPLEPGSHVVINWTQIMFSRLTYGRPFPDYLRTANWPPSWDEQFRREPNGNRQALVIVRLTD